MTALYVPPTDEADHKKQNQSLQLLGGVLTTAATKLAKFVLVTDFGAIGNGVADDTAAIQAAINSLTSGGDVIFPVGTYKITSPLDIGNGDSLSTLSTLGSINLVGSGLPTLPSGMVTGLPSTGGVHLLWAGSATGMIRVNGPLSGWGVNNMYLDGASTATRGIFVSAGSFGKCSNLAFVGFTDAAIYETTPASFVGAGASNSMHNAYNNISIEVPASANAKGIVLTGSPFAAAPANSCYGHFQNITIQLPPILATFGVYLQWTDSPTFDGLHIFSGSATANAVFFDYTLLSNMPSSVHFYSTDPSGNGTTSAQWANSGTPGSGARPNYLHSLGEINLGSQPNIANLVPDLPRQYGAVNLTGQTAAITNNTLFTPYETGIYRVSYYIAMTAGGTGGTLTFTATFNDGANVRSLSSTAINANGAAPAATGGTVVFRGSVGVAITYSVVFAGVTGSPAYIVCAAVERVG